jgi:hypothetical protein
MTEETAELLGRYAESEWDPERLLEQIAALAVMGEWDVEFLEKEWQPGEGYAHNADVNHEVEFEH